VVSSFFPASLSGGSYEAAVHAAASGCEAAVGYECNRCGEAAVVVRIDLNNASVTIN